MVTVLRNSLLLTAAMFVAFIFLKDDMTLLTAAVQQTKNSGIASDQSDRGSSSNEYAYAAADNELVLEPDRWGQYYLTAEINGRDILFLVDTGASSVALTQEDADSIGYPVHQLEYSGTSWTANGTAKFAPVVLDEVTVDGNAVSNVRAVVMGSSMQHSLLGMTFLQKLSSFEVKDNRLFLRW